ncbi:MAG TPA: 7-cyano-7-deazaguanine synthase [Chitinophagaceae bacterium]|nr:7-cyano-7-deazaguanine synthase [Chitinophagaceae bacterium]
MLNKKADHKVIVLHSGGIDSTACIDFYLNQGSSALSVFIDFGQLSAKQEFQAVSKICSYYKIKNQRLKVSGLPRYKKGLIEGRNLYLVSSALIMGKISYGIIALGIHAGTNYVDCSQNFIEQVNKILEFHTNGRVIVNAPFMDWHKNEIWKYCISRKVPIGLTYSCELGLKQPCGKCQSCKDLKRLYASEK